MSVFDFISAMARRVRTLSATDPSRGHLPVEFLPTYGHYSDWWHAQRVVGALESQGKHCPPEKLAAAREIEKEKRQLHIDALATLTKRK